MNFGAFIHLTKTGNGKCSYHCITVFLVQDEARRHLSSQETMSQCIARCIPNLDLLSSY